MAGPATEINTFADDPFSETLPTANPGQAATVTVPIATIANQRLRIAIRDPRPAPARYNPGTPGFRYWSASNALTRGINFWEELLPAGTTWSTINPMPVVLLESFPWLNAQYVRGSGLHFYSDRVRDGFPIYTAESPDVVRHELGHAVLDAIKPQVFNAASLEGAAFHEAFGDISAILCALQQESVRRSVIEETGGRLNTTSRLSRVAEQLGWAFRQRDHDSADRDALRNAANRFFYTRPDLLPPSAPARQLSNQPHSFSRVFTGAFLDALAGMFAISGAPHEQTLLTVSRNIGRLIVDAVLTSDVPINYFSQIAAAMIQADRARFAGRHTPVLTRAFTRRGILSVTSAASLRSAPIPAPAAPIPTTAMASFSMASPLAYEEEDVDESFRLGAGETPDLPKKAVSIGDLKIEVHAPNETPRLNVWPALIGTMAAVPLSERSESTIFVEGLIQRGELDRGAADSDGVSALMIASPTEIASPIPTKKTHYLAEEDGKLVLKRSHFNCTACGWRTSNRLLSCL
ncbi:hypothetical protein [Microvirga sp. VF16]|uniref:hypothetical protein n=1 Tax=Microvirga sp. VF16 TaxID=2807101 RepID=UPI00193D5FA4|nr:hypothetical protein [Microvirga sp. VF16]QRM35399.1 hypothetical protein JO965_44380 [Microvirga sp. VF16]